MSGSAPDKFESFYRMFPLEGTRFRDLALETLASLSSLYEIAGNSNIPVGYTYLGQFISHDITRLGRGSEPATRGPVDPFDLIQATSPSLDLNSLYGAKVGFGGTVPNSDGKFRSDGKEIDNGDGTFVIYDLPRLGSDPTTNPGIGDPRNDENYFIAQIHVLFLNLHNKILDSFKTILHPNYLFSATRAVTVVLYQQMIRNDYLKRILEPSVYDYYFENVRVGTGTFIEAVRAESPRIPIEFAAAAFRFGHSMVKENYKIRTEAGISKTLSLAELFGLGGLHGDPTNVGTSEFQIDWQLLFDCKSYAGADQSQKSDKIDPSLTASLRSLAAQAPGMEDLTLRNLKRGVELDLPCAQHILTLLMAETPDLYDSLGFDDTLIDFDNLPTIIFGLPNVLAIHLGSLSLLLEDLNNSAKLSFLGIDKKTPLWFYILLESWFQSPAAQRGNHLGKLGSFIVAEVFESLFTCSSVSLYSKGDVLTTLIETFFNSLPTGVNYENFSFEDLLHFTYNDLKSPIP